MLRISYHAQRCDVAQTVDAQPTNRTGERRGQPDVHTLLVEQMHARQTPHRTVRLQFGQANAARFQGFCLLFCSICLVGAGRLVALFRWLVLVGIGQLVNPEVVDRVGVCVGLWWIRLGRFGDCRRIPVSGSQYTHIISKE